MTDYKELVKVLRGLANGTWKNCEYTWFAGEEKVFADATDAIEALLAQLPKRGEWICEDLDNFRKYKVTCPHCGAWYVGNYDAYVDPWDFNYCPHCGNICNPTNIEYENELKEREKEAMAKMEVQDGANRGF